MTADKDALLREAVKLLNRYRVETPLGHQPHMIAHKADSLISSITAALEDKVEAERPEPVKTFTCGLCGTAPSVEKSDYDTLLAYADRMRVEKDEQSKWRGVMTHIADKAQQRAETAERQLAELQGQLDHSEDVLDMVKDRPVAGGEAAGGGE